MNYELTQQESYCTINHIEGEHVSCTHIPSYCVITIIDLGRWILADGTWNDSGIWLDNAIWVD